MELRKSERFEKSWLSAYFLIGLMFLVGLVWSILQLPRLNSSYSVEQFFPRHHPLLEIDAKIKKTFDLGENPPLVLILHRFDQKPWLSSLHNYEFAKQVTEDLQAALVDAKVISVTNLPVGKVDNNSTLLGMVDEIFPFEKISSEVRKNTLLTPHLVSEDQKWISVVIQLESQDSNAVQIAIKTANSILNKHRSLIQWTWAGVPAVQSSLTHGLSDELVRFLFYSHALFLLVFFVFFRGWKVPMVALLSLIIVNVMVLSLCAWLKISISVLLVTLPILVSLTFVSLFVHSLFAWSRTLKMESFTARLEDAGHLLQKSFLPNFLSAFTTSIGFAVLATSAIPAIQIYAWVVGGATLITFALATAILFLALPWLKVEMRQWSQLRPLWILRLLRYREIIFITSTSVIAMGFLAIFFVPFSSRLFDDLPADDPVTLATSRLDVSFGGTVPLNIKIATPFRSAWHDPGALKQLDLAVRELRRVSGIGSVVSLTDFVPSSQRNSRAKVEESLFLFSMSSENPLRSFIDAEAKSIRIAVRLTDQPSHRIEGIRKEIDQILQKRFPKGHVIEAGLALNSHLINQEVAKNLVYGFWQSMLVITVLLMIIFKSWKWALVAAVPNLLPPAVLLLAMAISQTPVKPGVALVFSIALGLAFNNTIYLLTALRDHRFDFGPKGLLLATRMRQVVLKEGIPCLSESLIAFVGFTVFLASEFQVNQTFGIFMLLSILAGILGDLLLLPAFIKLFPEALLEQKKSQPTLGEKFQKIAASFTIFVLVSTFAHDHAYASQSPVTDKSTTSESIEKTLQRMVERMRAKSEEGFLKLITTERNGDQRIQSVFFRAQEINQGGQALIRVLTPKDLKGTRILATVESGEEKQWMYNPKTKQTRRLVTGKSSGGLFGSEFSTGDLNLEVIRATKARILKREEKLLRVQLIPVKKKSIPFTQAEILIELPEELPKKLTYFIGKKEVKAFDFIKYSKLPGGLVRPAIVEVTNRANGRRSRVEYSEVKLNQTYPEDLFTLKGLRSDRDQ